jgi:hypothetical protein
VGRIGAGYFARTLLSLKRQFLEIEANSKRALEQSALRRWFD